jgi:hypothetical protein
VSEDLELPYLRAKQQVRSRTAMGIASFVGAVLASAVIHGFNMGRAQADKEQAVATAVSEKVTIQEQVAALRFEFTNKFNDLDKKIDHVQTLLEERTQPKSKK